MDWHAYSIPFQRGVEITDSERNILTNRIDSKIKEISNEDTDETFIEFLLELLSQGTSFGEIAENLQDVLMNPADWVSKLCEWLVGQVKEVLKLELTPAEKQFASMAEQLASAKKELEKKSNTNVNKDNEKLSIKKNQNSGSNSNANGGNNIKKKRRNIVSFTTRKSKTKA